MVEHKLTDLVGVDRFLHLQPQQTSIVPLQVQATVPAQFDISTLLASIMPLIMLMMVFGMLKPMFSGIAKRS